ncbi:hypothetical protein HN747_01250 [archaeon]|jgi:hypothetical protein|nr:hypothetical protein [archaeon]
MNKIIIKNEKQFSAWFRENFKQLGFDGMVRGDISRCPDYIMLRDGKEIRVELETLASNFLAHKHSYDDVDEIWCLVEDVKLEKLTVTVENLKFEGPKKVTLSIESDVYDKFQKYCEKNAIMLSKKVEIFMNDFLEEVKK